MKVVLLANFITDVLDFILELILNPILLTVFLLGLVAFAVYKLIIEKVGRQQKTSNDDSVLLMLEIPRENDKKELAAEQMFASLHGIFKTKKELKQDKTMQDQISFEFASIEGQIKFYVFTPKHLQNFVEGQIYAQYPTVQIKEIDRDYSKPDASMHTFLTSEIILQDNEVLPIKTFPNFEVDPLAAITATLAKLEEPGEQLWVQIIARPVDENWHKKSIVYADKIRAGKGGGGLSSSVGYIGTASGALWKVPEENGKSQSPEIPEREKSRIAGIEEKSKKLGYQVKIRVCYMGNNEHTAKLRVQAVIGAFKQFNTTNLNGFLQVNQRFGTDGMLAYHHRQFTDHGYILNIEELASVYHLPHTTVETPSIVWATAKTSEPPANLPSHNEVPAQDLSLIGVTNFRGDNTQFGIKRRDRGRHVYIIGQTGTGKSFLLQLLTLADIQQDQGFAIIDPHGDYAQSMLKYIPEHRLNDVIYFNPSDSQFPIAFNPMEAMDPSLKNHIASDIVGVLKRMFEHSWGPRLEYILRYTLLALLDTPDTTMLDITRMLTEKDFRQKVIDNLQDNVVRNFWTKEFASWNDKFATEAIAPILNKVGAFTANPVIRNIIGQPKSSFNIRRIMDEGKILVVNLSRGMIGEDNAAIMGALLVTKIQLAAMSRADIPNIEDRRPFYLYVDEFQNFATDSFAVILSEARKYALNLTVANQYTSQMTEEVRDAVFGNVGSLISLRVGAEDATGLTKYFEPQFEPQDLIQLHNMNWVTSMTIDGEKAIPFSGTSLMMPDPTFDYTERIVDISRNGYSKPKSEVEKVIFEASDGVFSPPDTSTPSHKPKKGSNKSQNQKNTPVVEPEVKTVDSSGHSSINHGDTINLR